MVLHFPAKLTEEEEALQLKYAKLRRKKKQLQEVNKPKQEPEQNKVTISLNVVTMTMTFSCSLKDLQKPKMLKRSLRSS